MIIRPYVFSGCGFCRRFCIVSEVVIISAVPAPHESRRLIATAFRAFVRASLVQPFPRVWRRIARFCIFAHDFDGLAPNVTPTLAPDRQQSPPGFFIDLKLQLVALAPQKIPIAATEWRDLAIIRQPQQLFKVCILPFVIVAIPLSPFSYAELQGFLLHQSPNGPSRRL